MTALWFGGLSSRANAQTLSSLDPGFNPGTGANSPVLTLALQPDGKIVLGGNFTAINGVPRNSIARLNVDGSLDTGFFPGAGANFEVNSVALQADGKLILGGNFNLFNGLVRNKIVRLNADGSVDLAFDPGTGADSFISEVALQPDGKILIGGGFFTINGVARNFIARLNANGSVDTSFNPGTGADNRVAAVVVQPDGKIVLGGSFTAINVVTRNHVARLNADGSLDTGFNPGLGTDGLVYDVVVQSDGKVVIGGDFNVFNGVARKGIARLNADGSLDASFNPGTGVNSVGFVQGLTAQPDGKVIIGGDFTAFNGIARARIARLNADGSLDASFNPGTGSNGKINALLVQGDGKPVLGGSFTAINGVAINNIARLNAVSAGFVAFSSTAYSVSQNAGAFTVNVTRTGGAAGPVSVVYSTAAGTAQAGVDFTPVSGTLSWAEGDTSDKTFQVPIINRQPPGGSTVTLLLSLSQPTGGALGSPAQATLSITQNSTPPPVVPPPPPPPPPPTQPTVVLTSPPTDITVVAGSALPLAASVNDPAGILGRAQFFLNGTFLGATGSAGPFVLDAAAPSSPGTYTLTAAVIDTLGRQSDSPPRTITVLAADPSNLAPDATLLTDLNNRILAAGSALTLTASASAMSSGGDNLARVDFYADGVLFASIDGAGNPLTSLYGPAGGHPVRRAAGDPIGSKTVFRTPFQLPGIDKLINIIAVAVDKLGRSQISSSANVQSVVTVNRPPQVSLGQPSGGNRVRVGAPVSVPASVSDPDAGSASRAVLNHPIRRALDVSSVIKQVEYFVNKLKVKDSVEAPFGFDFTPPAAGTYVLGAIATDGSGLAKVSEPLVITAVAGVNLSVLGDGVAEEGGKKGKVLFSRPGDTTGDLTVFYKTKGTAKNGKDYEELSGSLIIPAGTDNVKLKIKAKDNAKAKGALKLTIQLLESPSGEYDLGQSTKAKLLLLDND